MSSPIQVVHVQTESRRNKTETSKILDTKNIMKKEKHSTFDFQFLKGLSNFDHFSFSLKSGNNKRTTTLHAATELKKMNKYFTGDLFSFGPKYSSNSIKMNEFPYRMTVNPGVVESGAGLDHHTATDTSEILEPMNKLRKAKEKLEDSGRKEKVITQLLLEEEERRGKGEKASLSMILDELYVATDIKASEQFYQETQSSSPKEESVAEAALYLPKALNTAISILVDEAEEFGEDAFHTAKEVVMTLLGGLQDAAAVAIAALRNFKCSGNVAVHIWAKELADFVEQKGRRFTYLLSMSIQTSYTMYGRVQPYLKHLNDWLQLQHMFHNLFTWKKYTRIDDIFI